MFDIVFISYQESNADKNWERLISRFPYAKRVHGIKGIHQAHIEAAKQCTTDMFWVVDGDAEIEDSFDFDYDPEHLDYVYVWRSRNPINDLVYGNGGVKLLPRLMTEKMDTSKPDMTTSISTKFKPVMVLSNVTAFNTDEFNTWKSAFRECCKLASKVIDRQKSDETEHRLDVWCTIGADRPFGEWAIKGAIAGRAYGELHRGDLTALKNINDFEWLKKVFSGEEILDSGNSGQISEGISDVREVFFGLEEYLRFIGDSDNEQLARWYVKILSAPDIKEALLDEYIKAVSTKNVSDKIFRAIGNYIKEHKNSKVMQDAMSRSQMRSKIWLVDELIKIQSNFDNVAVFAGWFGQLKAIYDKKLTYAKMRIVEIDREACKNSDYLFNLSNLENYKVKSVLANINDLVLHKNGYEWEVENFKDGSKYVEKFLPNLIINTSAEHMTEDWFHQLRFKQLESSPIVAIQSNNMFNGEGHINCVHSVDHMKKKFPMSEILFEGELQLKGYKRVMLIGRL